MKFYRFFAFHFSVCLLLLAGILTSVGCSAIKSASDELEGAVSDAQDDASLQQDNNGDTDVIYFSQVDELSFAGGVAGTAKRARAVFDSSALQVILKPAHCEVIKVDLLNSGKNYIKTLSSGSALVKNCDSVSDDYMRDVRIALDKSFPADADIVPFFDSDDGNLYLYMPETADSSSLNKHWVRIYGKKSSTNYVTRNINRGKNGEVGTKSSLHFFVNAGLSANADDKSIFIDGVSIDLGTDALGKEEVAQKIASADFTEGRIYRKAPYSVRVEGNKVTFEAKFSGNNTRTIVIKDNQYTEKASE